MSRFYCSYCDDFSPTSACPRCGNRAQPMTASPPAREEAPAEGAGALDRAKLDKPMDLHIALDFADNPHRFDSLAAPADTKEELYRALKTIAAALRNRTSEPEAGAVAWRFPSVLQPGLMMFTDAPPKDPNSAEPVYTHPAPAPATATADKLRVAVEALEKIKAIYRKTPPYHSEAQTIVNQTLAALNEQPQ